MTAVVACGGNQTPSQTTPTAGSSVHLSAQGTNYVGANSRALLGFAIGVGRGTIAAGSRVGVADSDNGVKDSAEVWYGKSLQTAGGFSLDFSSVYSSQPGIKHVVASGNLFVASTGSVPSLTAAARHPGADHLLLDARRHSVQLVAAAATNGTVFNVGSDTGGQVAFNGNQVTYTDGKGNVAGSHTFDGSDGLEKNVNLVVSATVPTPGTNQVKQACQGGAISVANSRGFYLSVDSQSSTGSQSVVVVRVTKNAQVDCATKLATASTLVDVTGDIDGKGFVAISDSPPAADTAPPDSSPAPPVPPLTTFIPDPADANLLTPQVLPDGQLPKVSLDGVYTGTWTISVTAPFASGPSPVALSFSVSGSTITVTQPFPGTGTVDAGGGASFTIVIPGNGSSTRAVPALFSGSFTTSGGAKKATGTSHGVGPSGQVLSGPWSATASS